MKVNRSIHKLLLAMPELFNRDNLLVCAWLEEILIRKHPKSQLATCWQYISWEQTTSSDYMDFSNTAYLTLGSTNLTDPPVGQWFYFGNLCQEYLDCRAGAQQLWKKDACFKFCDAQWQTCKKLMTDEFQKLFPPYLPEDSHQPVVWWGRAIQNSESTRCNSWVELWYCKMPTFKITLGGHIK